MTNTSSPSNTSAWPTWTLWPFGLLHRPAPASSVIVDQPINPGWTFGNVYLTEQNSSAPDTERRIGPGCSVRSMPILRRQVNKRLALSSWRRATSAIDAPSKRLSSTIRRFSSRVQDRRLRIRAEGGDRRIIYPRSVLRCTGRRSWPAGLRRHPRGHPKGGDGRSGQGGLHLA